MSFSPHETGYVPHNQEVVRVPGLPDHVQLVCQPLRLLLAGSLDATPQPLLAEPSQVLVGGKSVRHLKLRQVQLREVHLELAHLGDALRVGDRIGGLGVEGGHLVRTLQIIGVIGHSQAALVVDIRVGVNAYQDVLKGSVLPVNVVGVVGRHNRETQVPVQLHQPTIDGRKISHAVVLHELQVIVAKQLLVPCGGPSGIVDAALGYQLRHLAAGAPGQHYQSLVVPFKELPVHPGLVVKTLQMGRRSQLDQVPIAFDVLRQNGYVVRVTLARDLAVAAAGGHVHLAPYDWLDPGVPGDAVKVDGGVQHAVVGDREALHAQLLGSPHQGLYPAQAVQQAVLSVNMQVGKQGPSR